jgi:hypothetical protein
MSEHVIRVSLKIVILNIPGISYFSVLRRTRHIGTRLNTQKSSLEGKTSVRCIFSASERFIEIYLRNLTCKNQKQIWSQRENNTFETHSLKEKRNLCRPS